MVWRITIMKRRRSSSRVAKSLRDNRITLRYVRVWTFSPLDESFFRFIKFEVSLIFLNDKRFSLRKKPKKMAKRKFTNVPTTFWNISEKKREFNSNCQDFVVCNVFFCTIATIRSICRSKCVASSNGKNANARFVELLRSSSSLNDLLLLLVGQRATRPTESFDSVARTTLRRHHEVSPFVSISRTSTPTFVQRSSAHCGRSGNEICSCSNSSAPRD